MKPASVPAHFLTACLSFTASILLVAIAHVGSPGSAGPQGVCVTMFSGNTDNPFVTSVSPSEILNGAVSCEEGTFTTITPAKPVAQ